LYGGKFQQGQTAYECWQLKDGHGGCHQETGISSPKRYTDKSVQDKSAPTVARRQKCANKNARQ